MTAHYPPPLRVFLEAGCDLTAPGLPLDIVCEAVFTDCPPTAQDRAEQVRMISACLDVILGVEHWPGPVPQQTLATGWAWEIELLEDPELRRRVVAALPADVIAKWKGT